MFQKEKRYDKNPCQREYSLGKKAKPISKEEPLMGFPKAGRVGWYRKEAFTMPGLAGPGPRAIRRN